MLIIVNLYFNSVCTMQCGHIILVSDSNDRFRYGKIQNVIVVVIESFIKRSCSLSICHLVFNVGRILRSAEKGVQDTPTFKGWKNYNSPSFRSAHELVFFSARLGFCLYKIVNEAGRGWYKRRT